MAAPSLLRMPKLGLTMEEGVVASWTVGEGERFVAGQPILVIETDKIANEVEAPAAGTLRRILAQAGERLAVGEPLAEWDSEGVDETPARVVATPLARRLARERSIDLRAVRGSGPRGRIKARDLPAAPRAAPAPPRASGRELLVAERMVAAKRDIPHFYLATEVEVSALQTMREQLRAEGWRLTLTHLLLAAAARAIAAEPGCNRVWRGDGPVQLETIDLGLAVDTPAGLAAPVLADLAGADLSTVAERADAAVRRARENRLGEADIGGSPLMTLSNAGMHDVTWMTSIIPPGQAAILGVGSVREVFRPDAEGRPALRRELGLVLSCDHRVLDGVSGLALLNRIKAALSRPLGLLLPRREG